MPMKEGPYSTGETDRLAPMEHRPVRVVDPAVDDVGLPILEAYFGPAVIDDPADRAALEAKLAAEAAERDRIRNSVPITIAALAAARSAPLHPYTAC